MILLTDVESVLNLQLFRGIFARGVPLRIVVADRNKVPADVAQNISIVEGSFHYANWGAEYFQDVKTLIYPAFRGADAYQKEFQMLSTAKKFGVEKVIRFCELNLGNFNGSQWMNTPIESDIGQFGFQITMIKTNVLMQTILPFASDIREKSLFQSSSNNQPIAFVDVGNVAAAILNIMIQNDWGKQYIFTGTKAYTYFEVAHKIGTLLGYTVGYQDIPKDLIINALSQYPIPENQMAEIEIAIDFISSGAASYVSNDLLTAGIDPTSFDSFLEKAVPLFKKP